MSQSCETLIAKINEWQKAIFELEKLSDDFLNSGDEKFKIEIDNQKKEIENQGQEYLDLAYPELPNGEKLFWPEKELITELAQALGDNIGDGIIIKNTTVTEINIVIKNLSEFPQMDLSLFQNLEKFDAGHCDLKFFPPAFKISKKDLDS